MSDFIVDNYKLPEINLNILFEKTYKNHLDLKKDNEILKNSFEELKNKSLKNQMELKKDNEILKNSFEELKNKSLKNQMELKDEIIEIKNKEKELNKNFIRKSAIEYLNKYFKLFDPNYRIYDSKCSDKILYEELLKIDYDNFIVSFAYFSENSKENFKLHPIYKKINNTLEFDYKFFDLYTEDYNDYGRYYNQNNNIYYSYYKPGFIGQIPYKSICGYLSYYEIWNNNRIYYLQKIYNEEEYIRLLFPWYISVSPQKFI